MKQKGETRARGNEGEAAARNFLEQKGLTFVTANWNCKGGEIDLIMDEGEVRVLVEVRLRRKTSYGQGEETVGWQKQRKLLRAAQWYQQKEGYWGDLRFDVVSILWTPGSKPVFDHIRDAFMAG